MGCGTSNPPPRSLTKADVDRAVQIAVEKALKAKEKEYADNASETLHRHNVALQHSEEARKTLSAKFEALSREVEVERSQKQRQKSSKAFEKEVFDMELEEKEKIFRKRLLAIYTPIEIDGILQMDQSEAIATMEAKERTVTGTTQRTSLLSQTLPISQSTASIAALQSHKSERWGTNDSNDAAPATTLSANSDNDDEIGAISGILSVFGWSSGRNAKSHSHRNSHSNPNANNSNSSRNLNVSVVTQSIKDKETLLEDLAREKRSNEHLSTRLNKMISEMKTLKEQLESKAGEDNKESESWRVKHEKLLTMYRDESKDHQTLKTTSEVSIHQLNQRVRELEGRLRDEENRTRDANRAAANAEEKLSHVLLRGSGVKGENDKNESLPRRASTVDRLRRRNSVGGSIDGTAIDIDTAIGGESEVFSLRATVKKLQVEIEQLEADLAVFKANQSNTPSDGFSSQLSCLYTDVVRVLRMKSHELAMTRVQLAALQDEILKLKDINMTFEAETAVLRDSDAAKVGAYANAAVELRVKSLKLVTCAQQLSTEANQRRELIERLTDKEAAMVASMEELAVLGGTIETLKDLLGEKEESLRVSHEDCLSLREYCALLERSSQSRALGTQGLPNCHRCEALQDELDQVVARSSADSSALDEAIAGLEHLGKTEQECIQLRSERDHLLLTASTLAHARDCEEIVASLEEQRRDDLNSLSASLTKRIEVLEYENRTLGGFA